MQDASKIWQSGYTPPIPFSIDLPDGSTIICEEVVRAMPGRRYVCRGRWAERTVFIKLFSQESRAVREWQNEQCGIEILTEKAIPAPELLMSTALMQPEAHLLVYAALENPESSYERWERETDEGRYQLLEELVGLLVTHHAAGLRQKDLHLRNFLYSDSVLYTLDATDIEITGKALSKSKALEHLADLFALFPSTYDSLIGEMYERYMRHRGWDTCDTDESLLVTETQRKRRYKMRKFLAKIFRTCSAFVSEKSWRRFYVYDRCEDDSEFRKLVSKPDSLPVAAHRSMIKKGNTCTVTSVHLGQRKLVSKRYNIKNFWHGLNRALRPSRAANSWRSAHLLLRNNIVTARPLALVENRFGPLRGSAWFIMQAVEGPNSREFFHDPTINRNDQISIIEQFADLLKIMHREQISHGDMKATNFVINQGQLVVLDLDSLCQHRNKAKFERAFRRDLRRFFENWRDLPEHIELFREAFVTAGLQDYLPAK